MADGRRERDLADTRRDEDADTRRDQARDAARIHRELAETDRIAGDIDKLLHDAERLIRPQ